jgi:hypothetical protein
MTGMRALPLLLAAAFAFASPQAMALNWVPVMKNTAFERFDDDDLEMFIQNGRKALNTAPENQVMSWENPDTGAGRTVGPARRCASGPTHRAAKATRW